MGKNEKLSFELGNNQKRQVKETLGGGGKKKRRKAEGKTFLRISFTLT